MTTTWMGTKLTSDVRRTVERNCANHQAGKCLLLDQTCFYHRPLDEGQQSQRCAYFESCVVDNDHSVKMEYERKLSAYLADGSNATDYKTCKRCGESFTGGADNRQYCDTCKTAVHRESAKLRQRKRRAEAANM